MGAWDRTKDAFGLLLLPYYVLGPYVDNWVGLGTRKHLRMFFAHGVGGRPLRSLVEARLADCEWWVRHDGYMWASVVECLAKGQGLFRWELSTEAPVPWLDPGVYVTPMNRAAAALVPELLPPGFGDLRQIPESRYASSVIYGLADQAKLAEWLAPVMKKLRLVEPPDGNRSNG